MKWYLLPWRRFAEFSGRARRMEYWTFTLVNCLIVLALYLAGTGFAFRHRPEIGAFMYILCIVFAFATAIPSIACGVRRLRDTGKSGWLILLSVVPIGNIVLIVLLALDGDPGVNRYGPNPKAAKQAAVIG
ncbi:MAG: DUF805 domain-containing protein [Terracidiphilus sp.]